MNNRHWVIAVAILSISQTSWAAFDFYKEAQVQESVTRDLDAAIRLYESFLQKPSADRAKQADAYLHLGLCYDKTGNPEKAKAAWKKVVENYSDQPESYNEAATQLKRLDVPERVIVQTSTPIVRVVNEQTPARWLVEFPRGMFLRTIDGKGRLIDTAVGGSIGFTHFPQPNIGAGMEFGNLGASGPTVHLPPETYSYFIIPVRLEKHSLANSVRAYAKAGVGTYFFKFENDQKSETHVNIGGSLETGFVFGMARGFAFNVGYLIHTFAQSTPSQEFVNTIPAADRPAAVEITQNRGLRLIGGPVISLSYRW